MLMNVNNTNVFSEPHLVPDDEGRWSGGEEGGAAVELPLVEHAGQAHLVEKNHSANFVTLDRSSHQRWRTNSPYRSVRVLPR